MSSPDRSQYRGVVVPTVTPVDATGLIDDAAVGKIANFLIAGGSAGIFPLGTTGEGASVSTAEKLKLVQSTVGHVNKRAMVYAGISCNSFADSVAAAHAYKEAGADVVVSHAPSYYPLSDTQIETYFLRLADRVPLPLVLYNIPITTHLTIAIDVVLRLSKHPNIVALKDSAGDAQRLTDLLKATGGRGGFPVLLGSSSVFTHGLKAGGVGLVPSGSHLVPQQYSEMFAAAMADRWDEVERLQRETDAACATYGKGQNLSGSLAKLKALMEAKGLCRRTMLPPLTDYVEA